MNLKQLYERAKKNNSYYAKETFEDFIHDYKNVREDFFVSEKEYRRLADKLLQERLGDKYAQIKTEHSYTEEGQEHFNQLLDEVEVIFESVGIVYKNEEDENA